jgi:glycosyltransferase involved in cell wall biosynthesis
MRAALERNCGDVTDLGPVEFRAEWLGKVFNRLARKVTRRGYDYRHAVFFSKVLGRAIEKRIEGKGFDLVFVAATSSEGAFIRNHPPIVYTSDATFGGLVGYYPVYSNLVKTSVLDGYAVEERMLQESSVIAYPSEWAGESAVSDHGADSSKVRIIPYGGNLPPEAVPPGEMVVRRRPGETCRLLFLGTDWERKGGEIACEALREMHQMGVTAELLVCGCEPPAASMTNGVKVVPRIYKSRGNGMSLFRELMLSVDFLVLPTRQECYGMVFCEASAFGVPSITTDTGGVSGAVRNGINGYTLPLSSGGAEYGRLLSELYLDDRRLSALRRTSRVEYDERLNWDSWARSINKEVEKIL